MAKDIQMKFKNESGTWEELNPKTNASLIKTLSGKSVETELSEKALNNDVYEKNELYTKDEVDTKVSNIEHFDIPVSAEEPTENNQFWFEII